jgi:UDP-glucose 4-epimerase
VIHLASASTPGSSARHAARELDNLRPLLNLLDILRAWPDTHLIFLSSGGTVYGNPVANPVAEDAPAAPLSYHGAGKVALESFLNAYRTTGQPVTVLRPSNTYGPGQSLRHGFGLVRTVLQHVMSGTQIEVWGDGRSVRDYLYIDDMVDAVVRAIDVDHVGHADLPEHTGGTYNIGSGNGHSINAVLDLVGKVVGVPLQVHYRPARGIDVREVVLDIARARHGLQWQPQVQLAEGIARTWRHLQENR